MRSEQAPGEILNQDSSAIAQNDNMGANGYSFLYIGDNWSSAIYSFTNRDVHNISLQIAKTIAFDSAFAGRTECKETHRLKKKWYQQKVSELLSMTAFSEDVKDDLFKYYKTLEVLDNFEDQEREKHYEKILDMIRKDVGEKPKTR